MDRFHTDHLSFFHTTWDPTRVHVSITRLKYRYKRSYIRQTARLVAWYIEPVLSSTFNGILVTPWLDLIQKMFSISVVKLWQETIGLVVYRLTSKILIIVISGSRKIYLFNYLIILWDLFAFSPSLKFELAMFELNLSKSCYTRSPPHIGQEFRAKNSDIQGVSQSPELGFESGFELKQSVFEITQWLFFRYRGTQYLDAIRLTQVFSSFLRHAKMIPINNFCRFQAIPQRRVVKALK